MIILEWIAVISLAIIALGVVFVMLAGATMVAYLGFSLLKNIIESIVYFGEWL